MNFDVQLWFAKDENNNIVTINEVNKEEKHTYHCPLCNSEVNPKQGKVNQWHFAHIDKSKCSSETMYHFWVKNKLLQKGDKFIIKSDVKKEYICKEILVEETFKAGDKEYRPDLTVITKSGETIYFEMNYSNEKKLEDYLDTWIELGNTVVEVDVKTLISSESGKLPIFKAKYYEGKCFNVKTGEDKIYHDTIGKYKERLIKDDKYTLRRKEVEKLNWFWRDIQRYKIGEVDIEHITELIHSIDEKCEREIVINILKSTQCHQIVNDCVNYYKSNITKLLSKLIENINCDKYKIYYRFYTPKTIYDRIYKGIYVSIITKHGLVITGKQMIYNSLTEDDIIKHIDLKLFMFDEVMDELNNKYNHSSVAKNLHKYEYPYLNPYYSDYYCNYRFYPNNFEDIGGRGYLTTNKFNSKEEILSCLKIDDSQLFSKEEIKYINSISKKIEDEFKDYSNIKIYFSVYKGKQIYVSCNINSEHYRIYYKNKCEIDDIETVYDEIYNTIQEKYIIEESKKAKMEQIEVLVKYLNNKYEKKVLRKWHLEPYSIFNEKTYNLLEIYQDDRFIGYIGKKIIEEYIEEISTLDGFKNEITNHICDYIRNYIYKGGN